ncbi:MAG: hypothetical protein Athens071416_339 [Parcubacteria group bacterium Athens0714_16]|nr:MAG: hypothetical protein Athens071416_339 [Parcubacteria group bacterium Athens0714_16]
MNISKEGDNLLSTKLAIIDTKNISDKEVQKILFGAKTNSEEEIEDLLEYVKKCRPKLFKDLSTTLM